MLKNKIKEIIYSDEFTDDEIEFYCHYEDGELYFNSSSEERACYESRKDELKRDIGARGIKRALDIPVSDDKEKLTKAVLKFLETL